MSRPKPIQTIQTRVQEMMQQFKLNLDSDELYSVILKHQISHRTPILKLPDEVCYELIVLLFLIKFNSKVKEHNISASNAVRYLNSLLQEVLTIVPFDPSIIAQFDKVKQELDIRAIPSKKREITLVFFCHGCDDPTLPLEGNIPVEKVRVMSVIHGCESSGSFPPIYHAINQSFQNRNKRQEASLTETKNLVENYIGYNRLGRLYEPISNRRLWFNRTGHVGLEAIPNAGIYIIASSIDTDEVQYEWNGDPLLLSDENNILSDKLHPSLKVYQTALEKIRQPIWKESEPLHLNSIDIMYILLNELNLDRLNILDWGCRKTCDDLKHSLKRIPSSEYIARNAGRRSKNKLKRVSQRRKKKYEMEFKFQKMQFKKLIKINTNLYV